jgi:hypothetical protein
MSFQKSFDDASLRIGGVDYGCGFEGTADFSWDAYAEDWAIDRIIVQSIALHRPVRLVSPRSDSPLDKALFDGLSAWIFDHFCEDLEAQKRERLGWRARRDEHALTARDLL